MKLAMRLPEKNQRAINDTDPRDEATTEVIDFASRTAYPVVAQRKGRSDALVLGAGAGFVMLLGAATLWGLNAARTGEPQAPLAPQAAVTPPAPAAIATPQIAPAPAAPGAPAVDPAPAPVLANQPVLATGPAASPYASPTLIHDAYALPAPAVAAAAAATAGAGSA